jgi:hypothetical protein
MMEVVGGRKILLDEEGLKYHWVQIAFRYQSFET